MEPRDLNNKTILFVTGRLAEASLREVLKPLSKKLGFRYEVAVPGVQVAALLHVSLLLKRLEVPPSVDLVFLPGWVQGNLTLLSEKFNTPFERGPKDLRDLSEHFGLGKRKRVALDRYTIDIIGEINHATRMPLDDVVTEAMVMSRAGADIIDVGCVPGESSPAVRSIVAALKERNLRVSIDTFDRNEVEQAVEAGAELILSCNHSNIDWVTKFDTEVVAIPDSPADTNSLDRLINRLIQQDAKFRIDPIIEPIGMGFAASLQRYMDARNRYPDIAIMMGIGNVTELTEVDSAGVNMLLAAICEELGIQSVLTTQVINWCQTAVAEFDAARKLAHHAITNQVIPKHIDSSLVMLRDAKLKPQSEATLATLAAAITDSNFRIFAESSGLHLMNRQGHWSGDRPFDIFAAAIKANAEIDAGHAFYLGYEMARAEIMRLLGKQYTQDEPISFGVAGTLDGAAAVHHRMNDKDQT
jgi:dihydropteroate synthase-like protein